MRTKLQMYKEILADYTTILKGFMLYKGERFVKEGADEAAAEVPAEVPAEGSEGEKKGKDSEVTPADVEVPTVTGDETVKESMDDTLSLFASAFNYL